MMLQKLAWRRGIGALLFTGATACVAATAATTTPPVPATSAPTAASASAPTAAMATAATLFLPRDVFDLEWVSDPQISPDGRQVVYVRNSMDIRKDAVGHSLWLAATDGTGQRPLAAAQGSSPRWSPDGTRIAWIDGDEQSGRQIFVHWVGSGVTARVTNLTEAPSSLVWSPDGRQLAFTMPVAATHEPLKVTLPEAPKAAKWADPPKIIDRMVYRADGEGYLANAYSQLFIVAADGGAARALTSGDFDHEGPPSFTPDGSEILIAANRHDNADLEPGDSEIYSVRVADGRLRALTDRRGPDQQVAVSPDGRRIAWIGCDERYLSYQVQQLYVMDLDGGNRRALTASLDRSVETPQWSADGRSIYFQYEDAATVRIARVDLAGKLQVLADDVGGTDVTRPYSGGSFTVARNGRFAYTRSHPLAPAALATGTSQSDVATLTRFNASLLGTRTLGSVENISVLSSADQRRIDGWIIKPPDFDPAQRYPLILEIHGGPHTSYGASFAAELQLYAAAGYVVLYMNPRGSTSYGEAFADLIHRNYPGQDYDDLMSGVDDVLRRGYIDPQRQFVTGGSGGGVLSAWIVGHTDRFRAAVVVKPVINFTSFVLTADQTNYFYRYWFEAPPWEAQASYWKRSPLAYVGNVHTPTMLMTGELDYRTPSGEAEQFYQALRLRKVDTALVRVPGASHDISARPSLLNAKVAYILAWFAAHDGGAAGVAGAR